MALTKNNLVWQARLDSSKLKKDIGGLKNRFNKLTANLGGMTKALAGVAAGIIAVGVASWKLAKANMELETTQANLQAILGATAKEMEWYRETAVELSKTNTQSAVQITNLMKVLGSQKPEILGNADAMKQLTEQTIILSDASGLLAEDAGKSLTGALNQFGASVDDASQFMNVLAAGAQKYSADIPYLSAAIEKSGKVASDAGLSFEQTVGALEVLAPAFSQPTEAGRNFKNTLLNLQKAGVGYQSGVFNMGDALEEVKVKFDNLATAQEKDAYLLKLFGQQGITAGRIMLDNTDKLNEYANAVTGTTVAVDQANINNDTLEASMKKLKNTWDALIFSFDKKGKLTGFWKTIIDQVRKVIEKIIELKEQFREFFNDKIFSQLAKPFEDLKKELKLSEEGMKKIDSGFKKFIDGFFSFQKEAAGKVIEKQVDKYKVILRVYKNLLKLMRQGAEWLGVQLGHLKDWGAEQWQNFKSSEKVVLMQQKISELLETLKTKFGELTDYIEPFTTSISDYFTPFLKKAKQILEIIGLISREAQAATGKLGENLGGDGLNVFSNIMDEYKKDEVIEIDVEPNVDGFDEKIADEIQNIDKLRIEATKKGLEKQLALLNLAYKEEIEKYKDNEEALIYVHQIYNEKAQKLIDDDVLEQKKKAAELTETLLSLENDTLNKRLQLVENDYAKKIELAEGNSEIIQQIEQQKNDKLKETSLQFYKEMADEQMKYFAQEQELARANFELTTLSESERQQFALQQQIQAYNQRLEVDNSLTDEEIKLMTIRQMSAQLELENLQETSSLLGGVFEQVGKSIEQMNLKGISSIQDFSSALYEVTKTNIQNYLVETIAVAVKNAFITSGNPLVGAILAGIATTGIKVAFNKLLPTPPKFADGGIVGGNSFAGDKVSALVNSGEMILNKKQQANLFNMAQYGISKNQEITETNILLRAQNKMLRNNKSFVIENGQIYSIEKSSGKIKDIKIL